VNEARREREERGSQEGEGGERMLQSGRRERMLQSKTLSPPTFGCSKVKPYT
jgi:hypothetical protein